MKNATMNLLKTMMYATLSMVIALTVSCSGDDGEDGAMGPQGSAGLQGEQGPVGQTGNANVTLYNFAGHDFSADCCKITSVPGLTEDEMHSSAWFAYLVSGTFVYPVPGYGANGNTEYRMTMVYNNSGVRCDIRRVSGNGENYAGIRIVRIAASNVENGKTQMPDIDFNNFYEVADYYGLEY